MKCSSAHHISHAYGVPASPQGEALGKTKLNGTTIFLPVLVSGIYGSDHTTHVLVKSQGIVIIWMAVQIHMTESGSNAGGFDSLENNATQTGAAVCGKQVQRVQAKSLACCAIGIITYANILIQNHKTVKMWIIQTVLFCF